MCRPDLKFAKCPRTFGGYCSYVTVKYHEANLRQLIQGLSSFPFHMKSDATEA